MRHARPAILTLLLALVAGSARADEIDDFIRAQMKAQNIPGLSVAIVKDGKVVKAEGYGLADRKRKVAATPETVYRIASVSSASRVMWSSDIANRSTIQPSRTPRKSS